MRSAGAAPCLLCGCCCWAAWAGTAAAFAQESNHLYRGEARAAPALGAPPLCAAFEAAGAEGAERLRAALFGRGPNSWRPSVRRPEHTSVLFGTAYAQEVIFAHQFRGPKECRSARFIALRHGQTGGIGCWMHFLAKAMELALRLGRVLVLLNSTQDPLLLWHDRLLCPGAHSWDCWFHPITNCTPHGDIFKINAYDLLRNELGHLTEYTSIDAPRVFHRMLGRCSGIKRSLWFYWWHAQWVTFFVRFNPRTRRLLDYLRQQKLKILRPPGRGLAGAAAGAGATADAVAPGAAAGGGEEAGRGRRRQQQQLMEPLEALPPGTVAVHVRHGDKIIEVELLRFVEYLDPAQRLADGRQDIPVLERELAEMPGRTFAFPPTAFAGRSMFLSTEDPQVILEGVHATWHNELPWSLAFTQENRTNEALQHMVLRKGAGKATLEAFLNLEVALEADAWVCTLQSNWCQLIDELRMTVGGKASYPFINLRSALRAAFPEIGNSYVYW